MNTRFAILSLALALVGAGAVACNKDKDTPHASDTTTTNADNTQVNERDRQPTVTPVDQGNSKDELAISSAIRQSIMSKDGLSFDAKNAKVVTIGTKVTLRGPVKSEEERMTLENIAKTTKGVTFVDDQLEVKK